VDTPKTLIEAVQHFASLDVCHAYMVKLKWPDGKIVCPKCGGDRIGYISTRRMLRCNDKACGKQFSAKVETLMEDSPLPLSVWFVGIWCCANGVKIPTQQFALAVGIAYRSAWKMRQRIALAARLCS
jgi:transposase-like protein